MELAINKARMANASSGKHIAEINREIGDYLPHQLV